MTAKNELRAEVEIEADPDSVWAVLMDFEAYPDWNPFIHPIEGSQQVGAKLKLRILPPDGRGTSLTPRVTVVEPARAFGWLGSLGVLHIFDGPTGSSSSRSTMGGGRGSCSRSGSGESSCRSYAGASSRRRCVGSRP
jgi:uncharacterized protein YndB with AHSA1/START domain